ncbi:MAG: ABC transporter permease [Planctomycetaceae bacterium]|nr:ABC transporter permease [Planctomycetaceae bacterium]
MNLLVIAYKSIRQRALASFLTCLSVSLGVMLMVIVLSGFAIVEKNFSQNSINYDLIVGPKGSSLQLILNTVYRIGDPVGNLPYRFYRELQDDPRIKEAVPLTMGDVTEQGGFKIVGTTSRYFELGYAPDRSFKLVPGSKRFGTSFDAIIGSQVAFTNGWGIGSKLKLVHGGEESDHVHDEEFTVVGVLAPTGTANDKTVFVNLEGFYLIAGHEKPISEAVKQEKEFFGNNSLTPEEIAQLEQEEREEAEALASGEHNHAHHHHETPEIKKDLTGIFVQTHKPIQAALLEGQSRRGYRAQFVNPIRPISQLMTNIIGNIQKVMFVMTCLIIVVSGVGIFVSIYNSMSDRRKEIAIMRALGARRQTVFSIILAESVLLCLTGGVLGILMGHGLIYMGAPYIERAAGILVDPLTIEPLEFILFPVLMLLATLVGFIPGMTAYRTDVADALAA